MRFAYKPWTSHSLMLTCADTAVQEKGIEDIMVLDLNIAQNLNKPWHLNAMTCTHHLTALSQICTRQKI